jgi:hypothetical protein
MILHDIEISLLSNSFVNLRGTCLNAIAVLCNSLLTQTNHAIILQSPDIQDIIPPNKAITILSLQLSIDILLRLLQRDIHIPVKTSKEA